MIYAVWELQGRNCGVIKHSANDGHVGILAQFLISFKTGSHCLRYVIYDRLSLVY